MGKQHPKKLPFLIRRPAKPKILREIKDSIIVTMGRRSYQPYPTGFWWNREFYKIHHVIRKWRDDYHNLWYWVWTDKGVYEIYSHRKVISLTWGKFRHEWHLTRELDHKFFQWWRWKVKA